MAFRFEKLDIWHAAKAYAGTVYGVTSRFPRKEEYGLTTQMNRAVNSISLNIAEGAGKRTNRGFDYHLEVAIGSSFEVVAASFLALDRSYITAEQHEKLYTEAEHLCRRINAFRKTLL
ncbi:MAG TPA: four helix bundle protein [Candidatus Binatia bacterium]|jgi:four helix bundle protein